jgi:hypothetical protein
VEPGSLPALEILRREQVEAAQRRLAEARALLAQRESLCKEACAARRRCEEALQAQRAQFNEAQSVWQLQRCEESARGLTQELSTAEARLRAAEAACSAAREVLSGAEQALRAAELSRRAISKLLSTRRGALEQRREREAEDLADDLFRARR